MNLMGSQQCQDVTEDKSDLSTGANGHNLGNIQENMHLDKANDAAG
jgi:hypothetical protein